MKVVGLTGGIASGKSTVGRILREEHGVPVIDADEVAREVVAPGKPALSRIVERFGADVLNADGTLDRVRMRARIANDAEARRDLEAITHPAIRGAIARQLAELAQTGTPIAVVEAALLVETGSYRLYDGLIVVSCSPETQLRRLVERDPANARDAEALIAAQLPLAEKERVASVVIRNDGEVERLREATARAWREMAPGRVSPERA